MFQDSILKGTYKKTTGLCTKDNTTVNEKFMIKPTELRQFFSIYSSLPWKRRLFDPVKLQQKLTGKKSEPCPIVLSFFVIR